MKNINSIDKINFFSLQLSKKLKEKYNEDNWEGNDHWWYFSKLVREIRELEEKMVKNSTNIKDEALSITSILYILSDLYKPNKEK